MLNEFKALLVSRKVKIDEASFAKDETFIRTMIHYEIDSALFSMEEARRNLIAKVRAGAVRRGRNPDANGVDPELANG
jgi:hypothetical protein